MQCFLCKISFLILCIFIFDLTHSNIRFDILAPIPFKQARKLQATLEGCNPKLCPATHSLTGVECRATSIAKNSANHQRDMDHAVDWLFYICAI